MGKSYIYIIGMAVLLLASCGQQHDAERIVKDFMETNMKDGAQVSSLDFDDMDSTKLITDSVITRIRATAKEAALYKSDIRYSGRNGVKKLYILRARYYVNKEEQCDTYYLDAGLTGVVAFKTN